MAFTTYDSPYLDPGPPPPGPPSKWSTLTLNIPVPQGADPDIATEEAAELIEQALRERGGECDGLADAIFGSRNDD